MTIAQILEQDTSQAGDIAGGTLSVLDLLTKGGWVMIPLIFLSFLVIFIFVERFLTIRKASIHPGEFMERIRALVLEGKVEEAQRICHKTGTPVARMIEKGVQRLGNPLKNIEASIENVGKIEIYNLEKNLPVIATISGAAPMLGFFGTVTGMIQAFMAIAQEEGSVSPKLLSSGIYEAMITTATGLLIGIVAYIGYNYLVSQVSKVIYKMEYSSIEFIDLLQEPH
jgi:biopolymer transport protein ExbB